MRKINIFLGIIGLLFLNSCQKPESRCILVLFDVSDSTMQRRNSYLETFKKKILPALKGGDRIVADIISDNPLEQSSYPINIELTPYKLQNKILYKREIGNLKVNISTTVENMLQVDRRVKKTKILEAMELAIRVFATYKNYDKKILVLFSDMIEDSDIYNFERINWQKNNLDNLIQRIQNKIQDFSGVKIYIITGTTFTSSNANYNYIRRFWTTYFKKSGAIFDENTWYGSTLIAFEYENEKDKEYTPSNIFKQIKAIFKGDK